jgi:hypothetical protein
LPPTFPTVFGRRKTMLIRINGNGELMFPENKKYKKSATFVVALAEAKED